jgi:hypothetical protein
LTFRKRTAVNNKLAQRRSNDNNNNSKPWCAIVATRARLCAMLAESFGHNRQSHDVAEAAC